MIYYNFKYNLITTEFLEKLEKMLNPNERMQLTEYDCCVFLNNIHNLFLNENIHPDITKIYLDDIAFQLKMQKSQIRS